VVADSFGVTAHTIRKQVEGFFQKLRAA